MAEKVFGVIGLGVFGLELAKSIAEKGGRVVAIDKNEEAIKKAQEFAYQVLQIDATNEESLKEAPIEEMDVAIVAIGNNVEANILATALLKKMGVPYILSRAISEIHAQVLKQIGANEIFNIEIEEGRRIANRLISPDIIEKTFLGSEHVVAQIVVPKSFVGKTLAQLDLRRKYNVHVFSIKRKLISIDELGNPVTKEEILLPDPNQPLAKEDILMVIGFEKDINNLRS